MKKISTTSHFSEQNKTLLRTRLLLTALFFCINLSASFAQFFPSGFSQVQVASGIRNPTVFAFAPDGRIFIAEQDGTLLVFKNGTILSTPFVQLSVNSSGERGLIGMTLDPNFATNKYIYLYYTVSTGTLRNRVSRFTANGDVALAGSEKIILELDPLSSATNHNGGAMQFGRDGKLYIAVGENAYRANAQNLDTYHGKVLRINPDGSVPAGNPFTTGSEQRKRVWSYGLRNPYTFDFQPGTGRLFVNDVGEASWEEVNDATAGGINFGWPGAEGASSNTSYKNPVHAYRHWSDYESGCAITGGVFFNPSTSSYPSSYTGKYFYQDLCNDWINFLDVSGSTAVRSAFASGLPGQSLGLSLGNDGNLYYLSRDKGALYKIIYTDNTAPAITSQPTSLTVSEGQSATFRVSVTGATPLSYQWQKNGVNIASATGATYTIGSTTAASAGQYRVRVTNNVGSTTSNTATLTVTTYNAAPTAKIISPANHTLYRAGTVISFEGTGTDPEDGTLPASAFIWSLNFHHDTHKHDGPPVASGVKSGSFTLPNQGETSVNVWYRLLLTVTDSKGRTHTDSIDLDPRVVTVNLATNPVGLQLTLNNQAKTTPYAQKFVSGMAIPLSAPSPQTLNGVTYQFSHWASGTVSGGKIIVPDANTTYTASFTAGVGQVLSSFTLINADTDQPVAGFDPIPTGATLNLATLPTKNLNIRANTTPATVGSVRFAYDANANYRTESVVPYCIGGDKGDHDYLPWTPATGSHTLTGTPYTGSGATGTAGTAKTITFQVISSSQYPTISITSPINGAAFSAPATIQLAANAADADGSITKVEFFNGTTKLGEDLTAPYAYSWAEVAAGTYYLKARATDNSGLTTTTSSVSVTVVASSTCTASGTILREQWEGASGSSVTDIPLSTSPTSTSQLNLFEAPSGLGSNYGARVRGYICPPLTGNYIFFIASDDNSELWLSTTDSPSNKVKIASVTGWTSARQWDKYASQKSAAVRLEAGKRYYIEALHKQGWGGDNLAVGWQLPNGVTEAPVPGSRLSPYGSSTMMNQPPVANAGPDKSITLPTNSVTLSGSGTDSDGTISSYSWTKVSGPTASLSGATTATLTASNLLEGSYVFRLTVKDNGGATASDDVSVQVRVASLSCTASGSILREQWEGVSGSSVTDIPLSTSPTSTSQLNLFEAPSGLGSNYGARVRGYICPPLTGNYTFFIASDDNSELWLSTTDSPANKVKIASVTGWASSRQWDKYASQRSAAVRLEAGKRYYIEALHKQGWGGDNLAVGWQLPNGATEAPIPGSRLSPVVLQQTGTALIVAGSEEKAAGPLVDYYPNPFSEEVTLQLRGKKEDQYSLTLYDITGREVWHVQDVQADQLLTTGKDLSIGVYILLVSTGKHTKQYKLVKAR